MHPVEPILGELLRFHVQSRSNSKQRYLVDLESLKLNGECGCMHFVTRCKPLLHAQRGLSSRGTRCWHIWRARDWLLDKMLRDLVSYQETDHK